MAKSKGFDGEPGTAAAGRSQAEASHVAKLRVTLGDESCSVPAPRFAAVRRGPSRGRVCNHASLQYAVELDGNDRRGFLLTIGTQGDSRPGFAGIGGMEERAAIAARPNVVTDDGDGVKRYRLIGKRARPRAGSCRVLHMTIVGDTPLRGWRRLMCDRNVG
jgi:hypothetical protein